MGHVDAHAALVLAGFPLGFKAMKGFAKKYEEKVDGVKVCRLISLFFLCYLLSLKVTFDSELGAKLFWVFGNGNRSSACCT